MKNTQIVFIGGGNMASSLIGGLIADGVEPSNIGVVEPQDEARLALEQNYAVRTSDSASELAGTADAIVLAVKPQVLKDVSQGISKLVQSNHPLVISIAAGVRSADLNSWLGGNTALVRTMPNTPALVRSGASALFANAKVSEEQRQTAESILRAVGLTVWVNNEAELDAVTAVSGSGPAYFFLVMEAMEQAGIKLGLDQKTARLLALQTGFGAAKMALESSDPPAELRKKVTSPGGTTEAAINALNNGNLVGLFETALGAAAARSKELGDILGDQS